MKRLRLAVFMCLLVLGMSAFALVSHAATVYVDPTGETDGSYATLAAAVSAANDGDTVVIASNTATPTGSITTLDPKDVTITSQNGAKLTLGRTIVFKGDTVFKDITLVNGAAKDKDFIYASGHALTFESSVTTEPNATTGRYFTLFAGGTAGATVNGGNLTLCGGTWHCLYAGNYSGTMTGDVNILIDGATFAGTLQSIGNLSASSVSKANVHFTLRSGTLTTLAGTAGSATVTLNGGSVETLKLDATVAPAIGGSVTVGACTGTVTTAAPDGYEVVVADGVYTLSEKQPVVDMTPKTVYLDGTGVTEGAYTSLSAALSDMPGGGTVIVSGNTTVSEAVTFAEMQGALIVTAEKGAVLTLAANLTLPKNTNGMAVTFDLPIAASDVKIFGGFRNVTFGKNFTVDGTIDYYGGVDASAVAENTDAITEIAYAITVQNGSFRHFAGGNYRAAYGNTVGAIAAPLTVTVEGGTFTDSFSLSGQAILADNAALSISGGTFACALYAQGGMGAITNAAAKVSATVASDSKYYAIDGDVTVSISGGTFSGGLIAASEIQAAYTSLLRGDFTVSVTGGSFAGGTVMDATQVKAYAGASKAATLTYPDTYTFTAVRFDKVNGTAESYTEPLRIAFVGDSITEGYTAAAENTDRLVHAYPAVFAALAKADNRDVVVSNYGVSSAGILDSCGYYYPDYLAYPMLLEETDADYIVIALGTNDNAAGGTTGAQINFEENYTELIETVGALAETDKVFITNALVRDNQNAGQMRVSAVVRPIQERIAKAFAAQDSNKYVFVDLYRLTLPAAMADTLLSSDNLHPSKDGFAHIAEILYGVMLEGDAATTPLYKSNDIYISATGSEFGSGTKADPVSRLDIAFAMLPEGEEATIHIVGKVAYAASIFVPVTPSKLTIVGEGTDAVLQNGDMSFKLGCDLKLDNLTLIADADGTDIYGAYHDIEMTESVTLSGNWSFYAGHNVWREGTAYAASDTVASASSAEDCNITLNGTAIFDEFILGNRRFQTLAPFGTYSGDLKATIGKKVRVLATEMNGAVGQNYLTGTVSITAPSSIPLAEYAPTGEYASPITYDASKNTGMVTVSYYDVSTEIYVDGTGATEGAYTTLADAVSAANDGDTVVLVGDTSTPTGSITYLAAKNITITSKNNAKLTLGRTIVFAGDTVFKDITLVNGAGADKDFIYASGHSLTFESSVTTEPNATTGRYFTLFAGGTAGATVNGGNLTLCGGTWHCLYAGNYSGTMTGDVDILIDGATFVGDVQSIGNLSASSVSKANVNFTMHSGTLTTLGGTSGQYTVTLAGGTVETLKINATVAPAISGSVTIGEYTGTVTTSAPEGYEVVVTEGVYTVREKQEVDMTPKTVYLDGTGATAGAYTSLSAALSDMPGGGTIILSGDTEITAATTLPATKEVVITSVYGEEDYRETAALKFHANLTLGGDTIFRDVVIERAKPTSGNIFLIAAGNALTMDEGVICLNYTTFQWITLVAGNYNAALNGDTHITVKSGHFRNVFGGNYYGTMTGDSYVDITGGIFDNAVTGGSFNGDFTGDTHVLFGGEAALITSGGTPQGLVGGTLGESGKTAHTHTGNIYLTVSGDSAPAYVFGASRNSNMTTKGNVEVIIKDRAYVAGAVYGGAYSGDLDGNATVTFDGGEVQGYVFGGGYQGDVTGNTAVTLNDGKICYYIVDVHAAHSSPAGSRSVYAGGFNGTVGGDSTFVMHGGSVYGNVYSGGLADTATVGGKASVTVTGGTIFGALRGDNCIIDLSEGGALSIGVDSTVQELIGGGTLTVAAGAAVTADTISGEIALVINGIPLPKTYLAATEAAEGTKVTYAAQGEETLVQSGNTYSIDFEGACTSVAVTIEYQESCTCELRACGALYLDGFLEDIASEVPVSTTATSSTYMLSPGLYTAFVEHPGSNWRYKAIYVYGNAPTQTIVVDFDAADTVGHEGKNAVLHTDEIIAKYYDPSNIDGYFTPDTPYFNKREGSSVFTTNEEMMEHLYAKDAACDYMYLFDDVKTYNGFTVPVAVFTMDEIPAGASLSEIAEIVNETKGREILLFSGQVHGNEPCGGEGCIGMISELCTEYGVSVLKDTNIGAIVMVPRVNPEGARNFTRETRYNAVNPNINRDYMMLGDVGSAAVVNAANLFMPTIYVDCHEAYHQPNWSEGELLPDIYDIGLSFNTPIGGGLAPSKQSLYGDLGALDGYGEELNKSITEKIRSIGIRAHYYEKRSILGMADKFFPHTGVYGFIFEVPGIYGGPADIGRRSFVQIASLKAVVSLAIEEDGAIYAAVKGTQKTVAENAQIYDDRYPVVVHHAKSYVQKYNSYLYWNDPLIGADGTVRYAENPVGQDNFNLAIKYRTRPTAYVFPADAEKAALVLQTLDRQAINYFLLPAGTTLTLAQYSGDDTQAAVGEAKAVTLEAPAYIVPVDGYKANVVANLFEPENHDSPSTGTTFVMAGYLAASDVYRSTESFIAAKLGLDGTYLAVDVPAGKTVASATVDGTVYDSVNTEGTQAFVLASDKDTYAVTLTFTDGTSETTYIGDVLGDVNGDRTVDIRDVLLAIKALLNDETIADVNGDGKANFADIIRLLKMTVK